MPSYVRMFSDGDGNCLPATMRELYWKYLFDHYLLSQKYSSGVPRFYLV